MKYIKITLLSFLIISSYMHAQEDVDVDKAPTNLDQLLELVKKGKFQEQAENRKREVEFKVKVDEQDAILKREQRELERQERIADQLEEEFKNNQERLRVAEEAYLKQLGSLSDVFQVFLEYSKNLKVSLKSSYTGAEFGNDREKFLSNFSKKMQDSLALPTVDEIELLFYESLREIYASNDVSQFSSMVMSVNGTQTRCEVVRVGNLAALCSNKYLEYLPEINLYRIMNNQPKNVRYRFRLNASNKDKYTLVYIDPRRVFNESD